MDKRSLGNLDQYQVYFFRVIKCDGNGAELQIRNRFPTLQCRKHVAMIGDPAASSVRPRLGSIQFDLWCARRERSQCLTAIGLVSRLRWPCERPESAKRWVYSSRLSISGRRQFADNPRRVARARSSIAKRAIDSHSGAVLVFGICNLLQECPFLNDDGRAHSDPGQRLPQPPRTRRPSVRRGKGAPAGYTLARLRVLS